jgi:hypothetical protein
MPSPCSFRLGVVRSHLAAEVQALRPSPLALVAGESMKIPGASRRSAAPGSQKVGAAEYGGDLGALQHRGVLGRKSESLDPSQPCRSPRPLRPIVQTLKFTSGNPRNLERPEAQGSESPASNLLARPCPFALCFASPPVATLGAVSNRSANTSCEPQCQQLPERRLTLRST